MRRGVVELIVGTGLLLGPLAYALTLEPEVEVVEIASPPVVWAQPMPVPVIPELAPAPAPEPDRLEFAFVTSAGIVLHDDPDLAWTRGSLRNHPGPGQYRAAKRVDAARLPEALWSLRGGTFDLYGAAGKVCTARLGDFAVIAQHDGPDLYELFYEYEDEPDVEAWETQPPSAREIRSRVWEHPEARKWLVAKVLADGSCEGALWARDAALPPPAILHASDETTDLTERRIADLKRSELYATTRRNYATFLEELEDEARQYFGPWSKIEEDFPPEVRTWLDADDAPRFVELAFGQPGEGCGVVSYDSAITAFEAVANGALEPIERPLDPIAVFDADLDGAFEMLYEGIENTSRSLHSDTIEQSIHVYVEPICPC